MSIAECCAKNNFVTLAVEESSLKPENSYAIVRNKGQSSGWGNFSDVLSM